MTWTHRLLFCCLIGCGGDQEPEPKGTAEEEEVVEECIPADSCCMVCAESQACGNGCISADFECSQEPGCACDLVDVCEEDTGADE
ncbi:MAG: hypothetical protein CL927_15980 [Deltaproteobacteria bacterium]|nr:hypothetical protein [Deltaproteobacteria bacterium]